MTFDNGAFGLGPKTMSTAYLRRTEYNWKDKKPVAPLSEYEAYRATLDERARTSFQAEKYRRMAILRRDGESANVAARKAGFYGTPTSYSKLPDHLK